MSCCPKELQSLNRIIYNEMHHNKPIGKKKKCCDSDHEGYKLPAHVHVNSNFEYPNV